MPFSHGRRRRRRDANWLVVESRVALADERTWEFRDQAATSGAPSPRASVAAEP